ncbi:MAG: GNAT family N-acetyltransferase [Bythopirellula sp.]
MTLERTNSNRSAAATRNALARWLYPLAKTCVQALPESLLRIRPYGVFEISLRHQVDEPPWRPGNSSRQVEWVDSRTVLRHLGDLVSPQNANLWDGNQCRAAAVWQNDTPVGVAWIAKGSFAEPELGIHFQLEPDEVWLFASVVAPERRRQGIYSDLLNFLREELTRAGLQRILCGISVGNSASLAAHRQAGAQQLGHVFAAKTLGIVCCRTRGAVKRTCSRPIAWRRPIEVTVG